MPRRYHKRQQIANQGLRAPSEREPAPCKPSR
jgi:hypothetical protein